MATLEPLSGHALQLLGVLSRDLRARCEHEPHPSPLASVQRVSQVGAFLARQPKRGRLQDRFRTDRHERQAQLSIRDGIVDLVEGRDPILPVTEGHEIARRVRDQRRGRDRVAKRQRRTTAEHERHAPLAVEPVIAARPMDRKV